MLTIMLKICVIIVAVGVIALIAVILISLAVAVNKKYQQLYGTNLICEETEISSQDIGEKSLKHNEI